MEVIAPKIPDVLLLKPTVFEDGRGFFMETFHAENFAAHGLPTEFVQDNHSGSSHNVLRGLHYQVTEPQGKLVRVTAGVVFDVAVDLRRDSKTFGHWVGENLSAANRQLMWIPPGFAHGFYVLSVWAETQYKCTTPYRPEYDRSLRWDDPDIGIAWPLAGGQPPALSDKDAGAPLLKDKDTELF
ncbi:MAG: dTDP-4-dehydrorhamnose 3,5-epimerase [Gammaproteobacteria bacterium]